MSIDFRQTQDWKEHLKQLQGREPSPKHKEFMDRLLQLAEPIRRTEPALVQYIEPYDFNQTESTNMLPITSSQRGLLRSLIASFGLSAYTEASSYGHPMQVQPELNFSPSPNTRNSKRKHPVSGGSHKQNLRASKRNGKQYKVRKHA